MSTPQLKVIAMTDKPVQVSTIATSACLIDLKISIWAGRKRDKTTTQEVVSMKNAGSSKATSVIKNLLSDDDDLNKIKAYAQDMRLYVQKHTLAWNDAGTRLLPTGLIFEVTAELEARINQFDALVQTFLATYPLKISAAAFKLGTLFKREEFPGVSEVSRKFSARFIVSPVPTAGDFRVDVQNDTAEYLKQHFEKAANARVTEMLREPWERVYDQMQHVRERMETALAHDPDDPKADGRRAPKLYQSLVDNALDLAHVLDKLNVTNDPQLSDCALRIRNIFTGVSMDKVRNNKEKQAEIKGQVDDILGAYNFSGFEE
jgi:hypothetical protein